MAGRERMRLRNNEVRLQLHALAYNLGNFMRTLALPKAVEHWSLTTLREKLIKIGAKVVSHGRYVTFQLAEVAVPRELFPTNPPPHRWAAAGPFAAMTAFHPVASRSRDRTGVCCAGRSAPSQCEMVTGPAFSSPSQPDRERTTAYRDSSEPVSRSDAHCVTVVGDQEQPSGESRLTDLAVSDNAQPTFLRDHRMGTGHGEYASMVKIEALGDECLTSSFRNLFLSSLSPGSNRLLRVDIGVVTFTRRSRSMRQGSRACR